MNAQALKALEKGNRVKAYRTAGKRAVGALPCRDGRGEVARLIRANPTEWRTAKLMYLLRMPYQTGEVTARRWLRNAGVTEVRRLGELTDRQRDQLARVVEG